jgi:hypothetical protein
MFPIGLHVECWSPSSSVISSSATPPTTGVGKDAGKKEPSYTVDGNVD